MLRSFFEGGAQRRFGYLLVMLMFLLAACSSSSKSTASGGAAQSTAKPVTLNDATATRQPGCTLSSRQSTPSPTQESLLPAPTEKDWVQGPADAAVTIVEYSDFQCPYCAKIVPILKRLLEAYPNDVRLAFRHFPLDTHEKAALAAQVAEAAGLQGKFWEMHDLLFDRRMEWGELTPEEFAEWAVQRAIELGLDGARFKTDMNSDALVKLIADAFEYNSSIGMPGTPFLVINGQPYNGQTDYGTLEAVVKMILLEKRQFSECPPMKVDRSKKYFAILHTDKGDVTIELFADKAPLAVNNFIFLANQGWYNGVTFHRVIPGFVAQAGDPSGTGYGGPGYAFDNEVDPALTFDGPGVVGMANAGPGSNGCQFFITYAAAPNLDGGYTIFGRVISGMDVVEKLTPRDPSQSMELPLGDKILSITIEEK